MRRSFALSVGLLLLFSLIVLAIPVSAASLTVGSSGQYKTITEAVNAAQPGDTIQISPGTYTENVVITKSLTITALSANSPPTVKAADPNKDVFRVQDRGVRIASVAVAGASNASGVHIDHTSGCTITGITAHGNIRAVYLEGAASNQVLRSNLAGNGYGVYSDGSPNNTISGNVATGERGESHALGDGIYLFNSGGDTIADNNCSANHVYGISLYNSPNTTISNNQIHANEQIGVRLRDSDSCTLTYNTFSGNGQPGKLLDFPPAAPSFGQVGILLGSDNVCAYLNNFVNQSTPMSGDQSMAWNSPQKMMYTYNSAAHHEYLGNYYSDYNGSDSSGTGVGSTPAANGDMYPLIQPFKSYALVAAPSTAVPSASPASTTTSPAQEMLSPTGVGSVPAGGTIVSLVSGTLGSVFGTVLVVLAVLMHSAMHLGTLVFTLIRVLVSAAL